MAWRGFMKRYCVSTRDSTCRQSYGEVICSNRVAQEYPYLIQLLRSLGVCDR